MQTRAQQWFYRFSSFKDDKHAEAEFILKFDESWQWWYIRRLPEVDYNFNKLKFCLIHIASQVIPTMQSKLKEWRFYINNNSYLLPTEYDHATDQNKWW